MSEKLHETTSINVKLKELVRYFDWRQEKGREILTYTHKHIHLSIFIYCQHKEMSILVKYCYEFS